MRPLMAAFILSIILLTAEAGAQTISTQNNTARSYPELHEIMLASGTRLAVSEPEFQPPIQVGTSGSHGVQPTSFQPMQSEAWPSTARPPSRLSEPVAAPPAYSAMQERRYAATAEHNLTVREIPSQPPIVESYENRPIWPTEATEIISGQPENGASYPPAPQFDPEMSSQQFVPGTSSSEYALNGNSDPFISSDAYYDGMGCDAYGMCDQETPTYRNMNWPDFCQEPDICGEFLPFGSLGIRVGNKRVIGEGGFFLPLWQNCDSLVFSELQGSWDDHNSGDGYIGVGYRTFLDPAWIFGAYVYGDLIATNQNNVFGQGQLGFELMSLNWEARVNGYAPGTATQSAKTARGISNGTAVTRNFRERAYAGWDFEIGHRFLHWGWNDRYEVRWFVGGYDFNGSGIYPNIAGPKARLEMRMFDLPWCGQQSRLEFGAEVSYDKVRNDQIFGYLRVRIPFGSKLGRPALDPMRRRMVDTPIHRTW